MQTVTSDQTMTAYQTVREEHDRLRAELRAANDQYLAAAAVCTTHKRACLALETRLKALDKALNALCEYSAATECLEGDA